MTTMKSIYTGKSKGLLDLLESDEKYAARYATLLEHIECMKFGELKRNYKGEFESWKNRKHWCVQHKMPWDERMESLRDFLVSMGPIPEKHCTLDRISPDGLYKLDNLRWSTKAVQSLNRSTAVKIDVDGKTVLLHEAAALLGKKPDALRMRMRRYGVDAVVKQIRLAMGGVKKPTPAIHHSWRFPKKFLPEVEEAYQASGGKFSSRYLFFKGELKKHIAELEQLLDMTKNGGMSVFNEADKVRQIRRAKCLLRFADRQLKLLKCRAYLADVEAQKQLASERGEIYQEQPEERWFPARGPWDNIGDGLEGFYY
jgi:hypothetical protein